MKPPLSSEAVGRQPNYVQQSAVTPGETSAAPTAGPSLLLFVILAAGLALRAFRLGTQSLWTDEVLTPLSATGSLWRVLTQREINTNIPPLYYVVVHFVLPLGWHEWVLRLPSMLFGSASIAMLYVVVRKWLDRRVALASAALLAISPLHIWYSQEARPYALLVFLSLLSLWLLQRLIEEPRNAYLAAAFALSAAATFYCHTLGLAFIAFLGVYALRATPRQTWFYWIRLFGAIAVLLIPAVYRLIVFAPNASADATRSFSPLFIGYTFWAFASGYSIGPTLTELHWPGRVQLMVHDLPLIAPIALIVACVAIAGGKALWRRSRSVFWSVALWFLFPLAFTVAGTLLTRHPFNVRYVIVSLPPFLLVMAEGLMAAQRRFVRGGAVAAVMLISVLALRNYFFEPRYFREDNRAAGAFLAENAASGDLVVADAPYTALNLRYYAGRSDVTVVGYPEPDTPTPNGIEGVLRSSAAAGADSRTSSPGPDLDRLIAARTRFWIFLSRTYHGIPGGRVLTYCDTQFRRVRQFQTPNDVELVLYQRNTSLAEPPVLPR